MTGCMADYDEDCKGKKPKNCNCLKCCLCKSKVKKMIDWNEFEKDLHLHIHLENNILFPKAIKLEQQFS